MKYQKEILSEISKDELLTLPFFKNRGSWFLERAFIPDDTGRRELDFSNAIKKFHEDSHSGGVNGMIKDCKTKEEAAFTIFQWLTTNIGNSVLEEALKSVGKEIVIIDIGQ